MKKKILFMAALLCAFAQGAWAQNPEVKYIERSWDGSKVVSTEKSTTDYGELKRNDSNPELGPVLGNGTAYVVKNNVTYNTITIIGKAYLILCDNATLTCTGGIKVEENNNAELYIYSQSDGDQEGKLIVTNSNKYAAGIGSSYTKHNGTIEIHGGNLDITGGKYGAGIGAGKCSSIVTKAGKITVFGGTIKAQGGDSGAGIGGGAGNTLEEGYAFSDGAEFYLYGGTVTATGGELAAGVGGGGGYDKLFLNSRVPGGSSGKCYIYGGKLTAQGGSYGAGIGGGCKGSTRSRQKNEGEIHIFSGSVTATGGDYGAGIGGGWHCPGGTIDIGGGTVTATGGIDGAGIGGGEKAWSECTVTISGGNVRAQGTSYGAGIGGGEGSTFYQNGVGADVTITGGTIVAIAGADCNARENDGGSAIGCGHGLADKDRSYLTGSLTMPDNYMVTGGDAEDNIERVFTTVERVGACIWRNYVKIEPCRHTTPTVGSDHTEAVTYTIESDTHTKHCRYCAYTHQEAHTFVENICTYCGKNEVTNDDLWSVTMYRASAAGSARYAYRDVEKVVKGQPFTIPAVSATQGLTLMGYATAWTEGEGIEMKDGETLTAVGAVITPEGDMNFYPRYRYRYVPTWTWDDATATATLSIKCSALSDEAVSVSDIDYTIDGDIKTATATYVHNGATYTFTDTYALSVESLVLQDDAPNEETLEDYLDRKVNTLTLSGRTLYKDGSWNTLCLPFDVTTLDGTPLDGATVKTLESSDFADGTLTLNFTDATSIAAGTPYIVKWDGTDVTSPEFHDFTITALHGSTVETDYVDFCGSFSPITFEANDKTVLYLGADNKLYYPSADVTIGSCRAVFKLNVLTAGDIESTANVRAFVLNFGDDETTSINEELRMKNEESAGVWYDLQGRKLNGKPTAKGLYIYKGKKAMVP